MNLYHLFWIVPVVGFIGYLFGAATAGSSDRETMDACQRCWEKWNLGIHPKEPGLAEAQNNVSVKNDL